MNHSPVFPKDSPVNRYRAHIQNIDGFKLRVLLRDGRTVETEVVYGLIEGCEYPLHHLKGIKITEVVAWDRIEENK